VSGARAIGAIANEVVRRAAARPQRDEHWLWRLLSEPREFVDDLLNSARDVAHEVLPFALGIVLLAAILGLALNAALELRARRLMMGARRIRILAPPKVASQGAVTLWMGLHAILHPAWKRVLVGQPHLAWEIVARSEAVDIFLWVPATVPPGLVERTVEAAWPGSRTRVMPSDQSILTGGAALGSELVLAQPEWFPIGEADDDEPLRLALGTLTALDAREQAVIQVLARPTPSAARLRLRHAARRVRRAASVQLPATPGASRSRSFLDPAVEPDVRAILAKASSPLWSCTIRIGLSAPKRKVARGKIHALAGAFEVFEGPNGFRRRRFPRASARIDARRFRRGYLLSAPELAQIAALPSTAVPGLDVARARTAAPPRALSPVGRVLGVSDHPGTSRDVALSIADARHHVHLLGETGTGKSTLIARMALDDVEAGRPAVVIDPKGDLVEDILGRIPEDAIERTCLLDPSDPDWAVGLNLFSGASRDLIVEHVATAMRRIHEPHWGPRTDDLIRGICLTLSYIENATIVEALLLLKEENEVWRQRVADRLSDIVELGDFWHQLDAVIQTGRAEHTGSVRNKLRPFLRAPLRTVLGQSEPKLDIERLLNNGGMLLVRIPKGVLADSSRLFGAFVVARVWLATMKRSELPEDERRDFSFYVDEMHNYLALPQSFEDLLAEARGYRLSLVLAHQHLNQLPRNMREATAANARTKIAFACSPEDAAGLEQHFSPYLTAHDLHGLEAFQAACRPCIASGNGAAFTFRTRPLEPAIPGRAASVRRDLNELWGRPRDEVETEISDRHQNAVTDLLPRTSGSREDERRERNRDREGVAR
jgi:hypothetical protein